MKKATKGPELRWLSGVNRWKVSANSDLSEKEIKDILDKVIAGTNWPNMSCQTKKNQSTTNSTIPMSGRDFAVLGSRIVATDAFFTEVDHGQTPDKNIAPEERYEGIRTNIYSASNWETLAALKLGAALSDFLL